tara:strand:- start:2430 stop:2657 length:228 start_codon:yes stop_codon:yes gene_type:complete
MEEKYSKDFLIAEFSGQIKTTEENLVKLREETARQSQQLVRLNGALEALNMIEDTQNDQEGLEVLEDTEEVVEEG